VKIEQFHYEGLEDGITFPSREAALTTIQTMQADLAAQQQQQHHHQQKKNGGGGGQ
jgi:hypothetical protein